MPNSTDEWRNAWREQWEKSNTLLEAIIDKLTGRSDIVTALEDLQAAVEAGTEVANRVATLVDTLQDQVAQLQTTLDGIQAQTDADLSPLVEQINAISAELTAAEAPNEPAEEPAPEEV